MATDAGDSATTDSSFDQSIAIQDLPSPTMSSHSQNTDGRRLGDRTASDLTDPFSDAAAIRSIENLVAMARGPTATTTTTVELTRDELDAEFEQLFNRQFTLPVMETPSVEDDPGLADAVRDVFNVRLRDVLSETSMLATTRNEESVTVTTAIRRASEKSSNEKKVSIREDNHNDKAEESVTALFDRAISNFKHISESDLALDQQKQQSSFTNSKTPLKSVQRLQQSQTPEASSPIIAAQYYTPMPPRHNLPPSAAFMAEQQSLNFDSERPKVTLNLTSFNPDESCEFERSVQNSPVRPPTAMDTTLDSTPQHKPISSVPEDKDGQAVVSALRTLQDRIRRLEAEKKAALSRVEQVESELSRMRVFSTTHDRERTTATDETHRLERLRTPSKIAVLEKRVDYALFTSSQYEQERDEARKMVQDLRHQLESIRSSLKMTPNTSPHKVAKGVQSSPLKNDQSSIPVNMKTVDIAWEDERAKSVVKERLLRNIMSQRHNSSEVQWKQVDSIAKGHKEVQSGHLQLKARSVPSPVKHNHNNNKSQEERGRGRRPKSVARTRVIATEGHSLPFVVGQSTTRSHSLTANIQRVLSLLKSHDPVACEACHVHRSKSRPRSASKRHPTSRPSSECNHNVTQNDDNEEDEVENWQDALDRLQSEHKALARQYDSVLAQYKSIPPVIVSSLSDLTFQQPTETISEKQRLALMLRDLLARMEHKGRQPVLGPHGVQVAPRTKSPGKMVSLATLRDAQKVQRELERTEVVGHADAFGGQNLL